MLSTYDLLAGFAERTEAACNLINLIKSLPRNTLKQALARVGIQVGKYFRRSQLPGCPSC